MINNDSILSTFYIWKTQEHHIIKYLINVLTIFCNSMVVFMDINWTNTKTNYVMPKWTTGNWFENIRSRRILTDIHMCFTWYSRRISFDSVTVFGLSNCSQWPHTRPFHHTTCATGLCDEVLVLIDTLAACFLNLRCLRQLIAIKQLGIQCMCVIAETFGPMKGDKSR